MMRSSNKTKKENLKITWFGHSAFLLASPSGKTVLIDPWLVNPKAPENALDVSPVDIVLITHGHSDHLGNAIDIARRTHAKVISIYEVFLYLQRQGVEKAEGMNKGGTMRVDGISITMVDAKHSSGIDVGSNVIPGGEAAGYVIRFENGFTVYHAGDTCVFGDMKYIRQLYKPDLAILPIGDLYTMGPKEAAIACQLINPKFIIGMHYGTFPLLTGTPSELRKHLTGPAKKKVIELQPGVPALL